MNERPQDARSTDEPTSKRQRRVGWFAWAFVAVLSAAAGSGATWFTFVGGSRRGPEGAEHSPPAEEPHPGAVTLAKAQWKIAGLRVEPVRRTTLPRVVRVTGKIALNEDRLAQVHSQVEGIVDQVPVRFGQDVAAGETLVVVNSQQIGDAKLELIKRRLATHLAEVDSRWYRTVETNVQKLIAALQRGVPLARIEQTFQDRDMGEYRAQLVSAYARLHKSRADYQRMKDLSDRVVAGKELLAAQAALEADQATMQALLEQIKFVSRQKRIAAEHDFERAKTAESIGELNLRILGVRDTASLKQSVAGGGKTIAHYTIAAPFAGTIIQKDVVLKERVHPSERLLTVADLSTVWVEADVFERHIPLLARLENETVRFRVNSYPGRVFEGRVFSIGAVVDDETRTLPMTAISDNPQRLLKPGMFVEVELPGGPAEDVLAVPAGAVQEHANRKFVFVHQGGERFVRRDVATGRSGGGLLEITAGLREGEAVVVKGGFFLKSRMLAEQFADED